MQYQSFPGTKGGSLSLEKLSALRLPSLEGKRFLDIGCNEGFFCGYALFDGAKEVVGIDQSNVAIQKAQQRFTNVDFRNQSWDVLPEGSFDVIVMLSALHYATDQEAMIHTLMSKLNDNGLLVLEISMAPGEVDEWVKVKRSIDERYFPTRNKLASILKDYAWKVIGHSVNQAGDPLQRYVIHIKPMKPYAFLFIQKPGSGKTTISRKLLNGSSIPLIGGDRLYQQISNRKLDVSSTLQAAVSEDFSTATIDKTTNKIFELGFIDEMVDLWIKQVGGYKDFALDSYIPRNYQQVLKDTLIDKGFFPVEMTWYEEASLSSTKSTVDKTKKYEKFLRGSQSKYQNQSVIKLKKLLTKALNEKIKWHLDSPSNSEWFVEGGSIKVSGWLIGLEEYCKRFSIYIDYMGGGEVIQPSRTRLDVVKVYSQKLNDKEKSFWSNTHSGFNISLDSTVLLKGVELGVIYGGVKMPLSQISVQKPDSKAKALFKKVSRLS